MYFAEQYFFISIIFQLFSNFIQQMIHINNINDALISEFKDLRKKYNDDVKQGKYFVAEGEKTVLRLLKSKLKILKFLCTDAYLEKYRDLINSRNIGKLIIAEQPLLNEIIGFKMHQGIIALGVEPDETPLPHLDNIVIVSNGIIDAENIGSIIRNGAAFGLSSIICDKSSISPYLRRAVRVSIGNIFDFKHYHSSDLLADLLELKYKYNYSIIVAELNDDSVDIEGFSFPENFAIVFGNEGYGVSKEIIAIADSIIKINIAENINSINVAASTAIFFHKISTNRNIGE